MDILAREYIYSEAILYFLLWVAVAIGAGILGTALLGYTVTHWDEIWINKRFPSWMTATGGVVLWIGAVACCYIAFIAHPQPTHVKVEAVVTDYNEAYERGFEVEEEESRGEIIVLTRELSDQEAQEVLENERD